jgi:hypothetical protein
MFQEFQQSGGRKAAMACLTDYHNLPLVNDNVAISGHAQQLSEKIRDRYRNCTKTTYPQQLSPSYSYHGNTTTTHKQIEATATPVPRSIIRTRQNNPTQQQWPQSPQAQQQQKSTNKVEERTLMSNLSPDDSAKTMMTNVSRMVETLGSVVSALAKESAHTNNTMKHMIMQQATTMNNPMTIMSRNEERRQEVPIQEIQQLSTATSTITNSQFSLSQQSTSINKRKCDGLADDETTAASTLVIGQDQSTEEDDIEAMLEEQSDAIEERRTEQEAMDITMADNEQSTPTRQETTLNTANTAIAAGYFNHQFNTDKRRNNISERPASITGANCQ